MNRRGFIAAAAPAAILVSASTLAASSAQAREHPNDKVRRLAREIKAALADPAFIGFPRVIITPSMVAYTEDDPDVRIAYAIDDIRSAFAERHPDWHVQVADRAIGNIKDGVLTPPRRRGILIYASNLQFGPERADWYVDYRS